MNRLESNVPESKCPHCGEKLTHASPIDGEGGPEPGNISLCCMCGEVLLFDQELRMVPIPEAELAELKANEAWKKIEIAQHHIKGRAYGRKCESMAEQYRAWVTAHPDVPVLVSFKIPEKVFVAIDLVGAIAQGFMVVDENGKRMLSEMGWLADTKDMPSLAMVRAVINHVHGSSGYKDEKV
jgi:hypothetical protein